MTISGTGTTITVQGTGLVTTFNYDFYIGGSSSYAVLVFIDSAGAETTITAGDFTITGVTNQTGGTFTYPLVGSPIASGESLRLSRVLPLVQNSAVGNQGNFYPSVVEGALDYLTMEVQQIAAGSGATIDAESLFGNPGSSAGAGSSIGLGSGLSFSGNTLVVSGISGSGSVTSVDTGTGLTGGPVTGVGTIALASVTASSLLANPTTVSAAPTAVTLGAGLAFSGTTLLAQGMAFITSSTPTGTGVVTFNTVSQSFTNLLIIGSGRSTAGASPGVNVNLTLNNDTGGNYDTSVWQLANAAGGTNSATSQSSAATGFVTWSSSTAGNVGGFRIQIINYSLTTLFKHGLVEGTSLGATTIGASNIVRNGGFMWRSAAAVTRIDLTLAAGNWDAGSKISLYGLT